MHHLVRPALGLADPPFGLGRSGGDDFASEDWMLSSETDYTEGGCDEGTFGDLACGETDASCASMDEHPVA